METSANRIVILHGLVFIKVIFNLFLDELQEILQEGQEQSEF